MPHLPSAADAAAPASASIRSSRARNRRMAGASVQATKIVSSPAMVPTTSPHCDRSIDDAMAFAAPGEVRRTTSGAASAIASGRSASRRRSRAWAAPVPSVDVVGQQVGEAAAAEPADDAEAGEVARDRRLRDLHAAFGKRGDQLALRVHAARGNQPSDLVAPLDGSHGVVSPSSPHPMRAADAAVTVVPIGVPSSAARTAAGSVPSTMATAQPASRRRERGSQLRHHAAVGRAVGEQLRHLGGREALHQLRPAQHARARR